MNKYRKKAEEKLKKAIKRKLLIKLADVVIPRLEQQYNSPKLPTLWSRGVTAPFASDEIPFVSDEILSASNKIPPASNWRFFANNRALPYITNAYVGWPFIEQIDPFKSVDQQMRAAMGNTQQLVEPGITLPGKRRISKETRDALQFFFER